MGVETNVIDDRFTLVFSVDLFQIVEVPHFDDLVFTAGGDVQTISGDVKSIDVGIVGLDGSNHSEDTVPDFESAVPTDGSVVLGFVGLGESDFGDPVFVVVWGVWWVGGDHFAFSTGVPQVHGFVSTTGEDLSVISGESGGEDFFVVTDELVSAFSVSEIPKSHGLVPRGGDHVSVVVRDGQVRDKVVVTGQAAEWASALAISGLVVELPNDEVSVSGAGNEDGVFIFNGVWSGVTSKDAGNHVAVTLEDTGGFNVSRVFVSHFER